LRSLSHLDARRRLAVLGPMAELGARSVTDHRAIADLAEELGIQLLAVGTEEYGTPALADLDAALEALGTLEDGDAVLVKGSRVAGLERLAARLASSD
jgi:UDP-N-acetylmuramoyl-tripeptide--D-alanyl-D-alanine ligase